MDIDLPFLLDLLRIPSVTDDIPQVNRAVAAMRGWLETVLYTFPLCKGSAGELTGHLFLEVLEPGDYYVSDRTAYFFRWQLNWAF